jgi:hypothetical protein
LMFFALPSVRSLSMVMFLESEMHWKGNASSGERLRGAPRQQSQSNGPPAAPLGFSAEASTIEFVR